LGFLFNLSSHLKHQSISLPSDGWLHFLFQVGDLAPGHVPAAENGFSPNGGTAMDSPGNVFTASSQSGKLQILKRVSSNTHSIRRQTRAADFDVVEAVHGYDNAADDHPQAARRCAPRNHANAAANPVGKQACLRSRC
jgi:hypothetical protein